EWIPLQAAILAGRSIRRLQVHRHGRYTPQGQGERRQGLPQRQRDWPDFDLVPRLPAARPGCHGVKRRGLRKLELLGLLKETYQVIMQVRMALRDDVHDYQADAHLQVTGTLGGEGLAGLGTVFVTRAD